MSCIPCLLTGSNTIQSHQLIWYKPSLRGISWSCTTNRFSSRSRCGVFAWYRKSSLHGNGFRIIVTRQWKSVVAGFDDSSCLNSFLKKQSREQWIKTSWHSCDNHGNLTAPLYLAPQLNHNEFNVHIENMNVNMVRYIFITCKTNAMQLCCELSYYHCWVIISLNHGTINRAIYVNIS